MSLFGATAAVPSTPAPAFGMLVVCAVSESPPPQLSISDPITPTNPIDDLY